MSTTATVLNSALDINQSDEIIAVMGPTGSGKSHVIDCLTQGGTKWSGASLKSVTQKVRAVRVKAQYWKDPIVFIDTPGFDDTSRSDLEVLTIIAEWLKQMYENQLTLTGIIYLHRITDNRMAGSPHRYLHMFGKLCGSSPAKRVLFLTTMWDNLAKLGDAERKGGIREEELKQYLKPMLDLGAQTGRFKNDKTSAWQCVCRLLTSQGDKVALIQEELVDLGMNVNETKAARALQVQLQQILSNHKKTIEVLLENEGKVQDPEAAAELQKTRVHLEEEMEKVIGEFDKLKVPLSRRISLFFSKISKRPKGKGLNLAGSKSLVL